MSKAIRILLGLLSLALFAGAIYAFADLQSEERITMVALRRACEVAGAGAGPVQVEVDGRDPSESLVSDAAAAGLTLVPLGTDATSGAVRLIVARPKSNGMFSSVVEIRHLGEGTHPGVETQYHLVWSLGWRVESQIKL